MRLIRQLTKVLSLLALVGLVAFLYIGLQGAALAAPSAEAELQSTGDTELSGLVQFVPTPEGMQIDASVSNVPPGYHGFHIHENPSCDNGGKAAGGHFNPDGVKHGKLLIDGFDNAHAGDLGNLVVMMDGTGEYHQTIPGLTLDDGVHAIANHSVILHAKMDTFAQPTGNAGGRIGCGVIKLQ